MLFKMHNKQYCKIDGIVPAVLPYCNTIPVTMYFLAVPFL